jgi:hypothetical protein
METFITKYNNLINFTFSCYDRVVITGVLPEISYAQGMTSCLYGKGIRIFDYAKFAEALRDKLRRQIDALVSESGVEVQYLKKSGIRKESLVADILKKRGDHPGIVSILSTLECCNTYNPWHDKPTKKTFLKPDTSKCLHYYIYFIDDLMGFGYIRIPTWCPFRLQIYFNGHNFLAGKLKAAGIKYTMVDNAFDSISDPVKAQEI